MNASSFYLDSSRRLPTQRTTCHKPGMAHTTWCSRHSLLTRTCYLPFRGPAKAAETSFDLIGQQSLLSSPHKPSFGAPLAFPRHHREISMNSGRTMSRIWAAAGANPGTGAEKKSTASMLVRTKALCILGAFDCFDGADRQICR